MHFSLIVPVYNRPDHIEGLLQCLTEQTYKDFELIVVESGSTVQSDKAVEKYKNKLQVKYCPTGNNGQGFSRNVGMKQATGDYFVILDSDILLADDFISNIHQGIEQQHLDAHGGPDKLHPHSSLMQKVINYLMTSLFTTGGTRGKKKSVGRYYPRSFNMGFSRKVYEKTQGFRLPYMGEDIELSRRIYEEGFSVGLIENAYVFHERKKTFTTFYKQIHWFGRSRINTFKMYRDTLKLVHLLPIFFLSYFIGVVVALLLPGLFAVAIIFPLIGYLLAVFVDSFIQHKNLVISFLSTVGVFYLFFGYAFGMITEFLKPIKINQTEKIS
ncbi:MAG: glycosyltransferase family 2 protein [Cyclobacteriaceae bacterium]